MQTEAPEAFDLSKETDETLEPLRPEARRQTEGFGWQCLVARRLAERGVRFIELIDSGSSNNWDSHGDMAEHEPLREEDRPADRRAAHGPEAARDARRHAGGLDDRVRPHAGQPTAPRAAGTTAACFSSWLAGGGVKGGIAYGATDDIGATVAENQVHVHDFHATILHLLGPRPRKLTYRHAGRDYRLTDVHGRVVQRAAGLIVSPGSSAQIAI